MPLCVYRKKSII